MTEALVPAAELARDNPVRIRNESAEYRAARTALLAEEIELRRHLERVAAQRRALPPGGPVEGDYRFMGEDGPVDFAGLFGDKQQRFVANVLRHVPPDQLVVVSMRDRRKRANAHSPPDSLNWLRCIPKAQKYQMSALWSRLG